MSSCGVTGGPPGSEVCHTLPPSDALLWACSPPSRAGGSLRASGEEAEGPEAGLQSLASRHREMDRQTRGGDPGTPSWGGGASLCSPPHAPCPGALQPISHDQPAVTHFPPTQAGTRLELSPWPRPLPAPEVQRQPPAESAGSQTTGCFNFFGEKKEERKENYLTKRYLCLPNPSWPQGLAAAQGPRASGFRDSSPGRGSGVPSGEQTQPGVACCPSARTQRPGQRQPKGVRTHQG